MTHEQSARNLSFSACNVATRCTQVSGSSSATTFKDRSIGLGAISWSQRLKQSSDGDRSKKLGEEILRRHPEASPECAQFGIAEGHERRHPPATTEHGDGAAKSNDTMIFRAILAIVYDDAIVNSANGAICPWRDSAQSNENRSSASVVAAITKWERE